MNILMVTNTFTPHVGGVARSVAAYTEEYRKRGHRVLVVAPEFENQPENELDVVRISAIQHFNGSDFSVVLPIPRFLASEIEDFGPDLVHSHHPFLLGATAVRVAHYYDRPLIFTHHTMYEQYTHYVPGDSPALKRFVTDLATHYANLCDQVIAPSESIAGILCRRGVRAPMAVVPTGVRIEQFHSGDGAGFRKTNNISQDSFVLGHVGRLAPEKNLPFLTRAVVRVLAGNPQARFLAVGSGPTETQIRNSFAAQGLSARLHMAGTLEGSQLIDAYHAMDAFVFASKTETQGMVLTEAMAAGLPVIALDAPGVREVVSDGRNGRLLKEEASEDEFVDAIGWFMSRTADERQRLATEALETARTFSIERTADSCLALYQRLIRDGGARKDEAYRLWAATRRMVATEWALLRSVSAATQTALQPSQFEHGSER